MVNSLPAEALSKGNTVPIGTLADLGDPSGQLSPGAAAKIAAAERAARVPVGQVTNKR